jgi:hypothetical protein
MLSMIHEEGYGQRRAYILYYLTLVLHIQFLVFCDVIVVIILQERSHCDVIFEVSVYRKHRNGAEYVSRGRHIAPNAGTCSIIMIILYYSL